MRGTLDCRVVSLLARSGARRSLAALATLDSNGDGVIDKDDARFGELRIRRDFNGSTEAGELVSLADLGIAEIGTAKPGGNMAAFGAGGGEADWRPRERAGHRFDDFA